MLRHLPERRRVGAVAPVVRLRGALEPALEVDAERLGAARPRSAKPATRLGSSPASGRLVSDGGRGRAVVARARAPGCRRRSRRTTGRSATGGATRASATAAAARTARARVRARGPAHGQPSPAARTTSTGHPTRRLAIVARCVPVQVVLRRLRTRATTSAPVILLRRAARFSRRGPRCSSCSRSATRSGGLPGPAARRPGSGVGSSAGLGGPEEVQQGDVGADGEDGGRARSASRGRPGRRAAAATATTDEEVAQPQQAPQRRPPSAHVVQGVAQQEAPPHRRQAEHPAQAVVEGGDGARRVDEHRDHQADPGGDAEAAVVRDAPRAPRRGRGGPGPSRGGPRPSPTRSAARRGTR